MRLAISEARKAVTSGCGLPIGAVVVDPQKNNQLIAVVHDCRILSPSSASFSSSSTSSSSPQLISDPSSKCLKVDTHDMIRHPLRHATMICIDQVAKKELAKERGGLPPPASSSPSTPFLSSSSSEEEGYLCSGFDLYLTREPCMMCSMAIVHSRFGRVFYGSEHPRGLGAFGSRFWIHMDSRLNHHFLVYRGLLKLSCDSLLSKQ
jgi:tRNA(Arg) A34 adenosine deaminase TadA